MFVGAAAWQVVACVPAGDVFGCVAASGQAVAAACVDRRDVVSPGVNRWYIATHVHRSCVRRAAHVSQVATGAV
ncbi:hypothetical protein ABZX83_26745, partial [Streptomyces thermoviolaceus]|uniref:hypothetical protein n=1 Tax=Streptomyces thermoviolaceus TaxID=1952 RepID=UPI00339F8355